jgi:mRNA interferase MazF
MPNQPPVIKQGEIYWCDPDPQRKDTVGSEQEGYRPWLIVSREELTRGKCVVGLPLSRHVEKALHHLIAIPARHISVQDGSDVMDRVALTDQIRCLDKTRLRKKLGELSPDGIKSVFTGLDYLFGRSYPSPLAN